MKGEKLNSADQANLWCRTPEIHTASSQCAWPAVVLFFSVEPAASLPGHQAFLAVECRCCRSNFCCSFLSCGRKWEQRSPWRRGILVFGTWQAYVQAVLPPPLKTPGKSRTSLTHFPVPLYPVNDCLASAPRLSMLQYSVWADDIMGTQMYTNGNQIYVFQELHPDH